eukprot:gene14566-biopygen9162
MSAFWRNMRQPNVKTHVGSHVEDYVPLGPDRVKGAVSGQHRAQPIQRHAMAEQDCAAMTLLGTLLKTNSPLGYWVGNYVERDDRRRGLVDRHTARGSAFLLGSAGGAASRAAALRRRRAAVRARTGLETMLAQLC